MLHFCTFALGGKCTYEHKGISCTKCLTCLNFLQNKVLPSLRNVNDTVSSNDKDEVDTTTDAVPKLSKSVTNYA